jgi:hypothetical protein
MSQPREEEKHSKWLEIEDDFLLFLQGEIIGEDQDIVFYEISGATKFINRGNKVKIDNRVNGFFQFFYQQDYLEEIYNSYQGYKGYRDNREKLWVKEVEEQKILRQIELDFPRQDYFINDQHCSSFNDYIYFCQNFSCSKVVKMLSTQASFAYIIETMMKYYSNFHLVSNHFSSDHFSDSGINYSTRPQIKLFSSSKKGEVTSTMRMEIKIYKYLFDLEKEKNIGTIDCSLHIDLSDLSSSLSDSSSKLLDLLSWKTLLF